MKEDIRKELKRKRNEYLLRIVDEFKATDNVQNIYYCYEYVKEYYYTSHNSLINNLNNEELELFNKNSNVWLIPIETMNTFGIFLNNNEIYFN